MSRGFRPKNGEIFNKDGHGPKIFNGFGTTRTSQSPTLFVTNLPPSVTMAMLESVFSLDPGFQQMRTVRHMIFVDYYDIRTATDAMRRHQNHKFEGHPVEQGIMIDYDKDPRHKRNKAFTSQQERGAYSHGLGHELPSSGHYGPGGPRTGIHMAATRAQPLPPPDPTLELINKIKAEHAANQGVVVSEWEAKRGEKRLREREERRAAASARAGSYDPHVTGRNGAVPEHGGGGVAIALPPQKASGTGSGISIGASMPVGKLVRKEKKPKKVLAVSAQKGNGGEVTCTASGLASSSTEVREGAESQSHPDGGGSVLGLVGYGSSEDEGD